MTAKQLRWARNVIKRFGRVECVPGSRAHAVRLERLKRARAMLLAHALTKS